MTIMQMLVIAGAFMVAGIAKGALGMGMPPIALGLMSFALPLQDAIAIMVIPTLITNIWQAIYGGGFMPLMRRFWSMTAASIAGILAVAVGFGGLGSQRAVGWVGLTLVLYAVVALVAWRPRVPRRAEWWANPLIGVTSGAAAGITGVAAVPFLPYMQSLELSRHELVQALGILFLFMIGAITLALAWQGGFHLANTASGIAAIAPTMAGVWLGQKVREVLSPETFRKIFLISLLVLGLQMAHGLV